jgi:hypothetical protein
MATHPIECSRFLLGALEALLVIWLENASAPLLLKGGGRQVSSLDLQASLRLPALWFLVVYMGGYVFARAAALLLGPAPTPGFAAFIIFEVVSLTLSAVALRTAYRS